MTGDTVRGFYNFSGNVTITSEGPHGPAFGGNYVALPTEDEWYKAAYHKNDGVTGNYYLYPTSSNAAPTVALSNAVGDIANPGVNVANYDFGAIWTDYHQWIGNRAQPLFSSGQGRANSRRSAFSGRLICRVEDTLILMDHTERQVASLYHKDARNASLPKQRGSATVGTHCARL